MLHITHKLYICRQMALRNDLTRHSVVLCRSWSMKSRMTGMYTWNYPVCLYRVSTQKSTGYSPFYMMFHRHPRLPIDAELQQSSVDEDTNVESFVDKMLQVRDTIKVKACSNIEEAQQKQREYYDCRHSPEVRLNLYSLSLTCIPDCTNTCIGNTNWD